MKKIPILAFLVTLLASAAMADSSWGVGSLQSVTNAGATTTTAIGWGGGYGSTGCTGDADGNLSCDGTIISFPNATPTFTFALTDWLLTDWQLSQETNVVWGMYERGAGTATTTGNVSFGRNNTLLGYLTGYDFTTAWGNTCIGSTACENITDADSIVAVGYGAGNNASDYTVAIGALSAQSTGTFNTAVGYNTLRTTTGTTNTAMGINAGETAQGDNGVYVGANAGNAASGDFDVFIGSGAGDDATGGYGVGIGYNALGNASLTGDANTAIGYAACDGMTSGAKNICIGQESDLVDGTKNYRMSIANSYWGDFSAGAAGSTIATTTARFGIATSTLNAALTIAIPTTNTYDVIQANNGGSGDFLDYYDNGVPVFSVDEDGTVGATGGVRFAGDGDILAKFDEGPWTPTATATLATCTNSVQVGTYQKIGNHMYLDFRVSTTACSGSGNFYITGVPYTSTNTSNYISGCTITYFHNFSVAAGYVPTAVIGANTTNIQLYQFATGGSASTEVQVDTGGFAIAGFCHYTTD